MRATEIAILGETLDRMEQTWLGRQETKEKRTSELVDTITPQAAEAAECSPQAHFLKIRSSLEDDADFVCRTLSHR